MIFFNGSKHIWEFGGNKNLTLFGRPEVLKKVLWEVLLKDV